MDERSAVELALQFVETINQHDVNGIAELMPPDHLFTDSLGKTVQDRDKMIAGWTHYFSSFPDYSISCNETFERGNVVVLLGEAAGTYCPDGQMRNEYSWRMPAAWKAVIKDNLIAEWQVYADNHPVFEIIEAYKKVHS